MKTGKYFTAEWCGPCKVFRPKIEELIAEGYSIEIIDVTDDDNLRIKYNVRSIPTIIIEQDGEEVNRIIGSQSTKQEIIDALTIGKI